MKKTTSISTASTRAKRLNVSEAKAKLSQTLHQIDDAPTIIHNRGRDIAVLLSIQEYERIVAAGEASQPNTMRVLIEDIEAIKQRFGGGVNFEPERAELSVQDPFARRRSR